MEPTPAVAAALVPVSVALLWIGASVFVGSAARLARAVGLSDLVIGLTIVAMGTSAPEVAVTVEAALLGNGDVAVGNVVGSNLFNLGVVLGGIAAAVGIRSSAPMVRRDGAAMIAATVAILLFLRDGRLGSVEGAALLVGMGGYLAWVLLRARRAEDSFGRTGADADAATADAGPAGVAAVVAPGFDGTGAATDPGWRTAARLAVGLALVVVGADLLVGSAVALASAAGVSDWVIGESVVAVGTSTPEVATSVAAARRGLGDVAAGNLLGSNVFNALFILGLASVAAPLSVSPIALGSLWWLLGLSALAVGLLASGRRLGRIEGVVLILANLTRWALNLLSA